MIPGPSALQYPQLNLVESISSNGATISAGATTTMTWDTKNSGSTLLDLTTPSFPVVLNTGFYIMTANLQGTSFTIGANYEGEMYIRSGGATMDVLGSSPAATATVNIMKLALTGGAYLGSGSALQIDVKNNDSSPRALSLTVIIARIL